jgi:hypothetical protein
MKLVLYYNKNKFFLTGWWSMAQLAAQDYFTRLQASGLGGQVPFGHPELAAMFPQGLGMSGGNMGTGSGGNNSNNTNSGGGGSGGGGNNRSSNSSKNKKKDKGGNSGGHHGGGGGNSYKVSLTKCEKTNLLHYSLI